MGHSCAQRPHELQSPVHTLTVNRASPPAPRVLWMRTAPCGQTSEHRPQLTHLLLSHTGTALAMCRCGYLPPTLPAHWAKKSPVLASRGASMRSPTPAGTRADVMSSTRTVGKLPAAFSSARWSGGSPPNKCRPTLMTPATYARPPCVPSLCASLYTVGRTAASRRSTPAGRVFLSSSAGVSVHTISVPPRPSCAMWRSSRRRWAEGSETTSAS